MIPYRVQAQGVYSVSRQHSIYYASELSSKVDAHPARAGPLSQVQIQSFVASEPKSSRGKRGILMLEGLNHTI